MFINILHGLPKLRRHVRIHRNGIKKRHAAEVALIAQISLPENARVLRDDVDLPETHIHERPKRDGLRRKRCQPFGAGLLHHLPESRRERNDPGQGGRLKNVVGEKRDWLIDCPQAVRRAEKGVRQAAEVVRKHLGINVENRDEHLVRREIPLIHNKLLRFARRPGLVRTLAGKFAGKTGRVRDNEQFAEASGEFRLYSFGGLGRLFSGSRFGRKDDENFFFRIIRFRQTLESFPNHRVGLVVHRQDHKMMYALPRSRKIAPQLFEPVERQVGPHLREGRTQVERQIYRLQEPVDVEHNNENGNRRGREPRKDHHQDERQPGKRCRQDFEKALHQVFSRTNRGRRQAPRRPNPKWRGPRRRRGSGGLAPCPR